MDAAIPSMAEEDGIGGRRSGVGVALLLMAAKSPVVTDGQRPWIRDSEPCSSHGRLVLR